MLRSSVSGKALGFEFKSKGQGAFLQDWMLKSNMVPTGRSFGMQEQKAERHKSEDCGIEENFHCKIRLRKIWA